MQAYLVVFLGAGLGGALRHGVNLASAHLWGTAFPFGTLAVNVIGGIAMGVIGGYFAFFGDASQHWRLFLTTGVLGGFTTFSSFGYETFTLWRDGLAGKALLNIGATMILSLGAVWVGHLCARLLPGG